MTIFTKWSKVNISVQTALATADTITGVTKANPGVVSSTAHGMANGVYAVLAVNGMSQIDERVVRVANKTLDTWELEGIDTTSFDTFASGTSQEITFGGSLGVAASVTASGGEYNFIDITLLQDAVSRQMPGVVSPITFTCDCIWDVTNADLLALKQASESEQKRAFLFSFANGQKLAFNGYVGATLIPTGAAQELVKTSVVITATGNLTVYAS